MAKNWGDPQHYNMKICKSPQPLDVKIRGQSGSVSETLSWTLEGWGQTILRGSRDVAGCLVVKDGYHAFQTVDTNPQEVFLAGQASMEIFPTEVLAYCFSDVSASNQLPTASTSVATVTRRTDPTPDPVQHIDTTTMTCVTD